jgi:hypothetical protein
MIDCTGNRDQDRLTVSRPSRWALWNVDRWHSASLIGAGQHPRRGSWLPSDEHPGGIRTGRGLQAQWLSQGGSAGSDTRGGPGSPLRAGEVVIRAQGVVHGRDVGERRDSAQGMASRRTEPCPYSWLALSVASALTRLQWPRWPAQGDNARACEIESCGSLRLTAMRDRC